MKRVISILAVALFVAFCVAPASAAPRAEKEWTWMVFLNADNNLDSFGVQDQDEMAKVGSNDWLNIVSLIDREKGPATLNYIEKGKVTPVKDMGELDMGDYKLLTQFVKDMAAQYPAKHYALIVWNHGSGWKNKPGDNIMKGISYDDSTGNHITTNQLTLVTSEIKKALGRNLDIFSFDACLMQMAEVAYAMKGDVDYIVASEETEPGAGYPYDGILATLKKDMTPAEFCKTWVAAYTASYNNGSQGSSASTQSALDMSKFDAMIDAINGFAKASIAGSYGAQFKDALAKVQKFYYRTNIDLPHLVSLLKTTIKDEAFLTAANKLEVAMADAILANGTNGSTMKNAKGLAVFFPNTSYSFSSDYLALDYAKNTLWDEMVQDFYKKTTAPKIVADLQNGDISSMMEYVRTANANNREVSADLIGKVNFAIFAENATTASVQELVKNLVSELKTK
ncbi:MAG TPA: clostripain-related cysteine peptidase [Candidatus Ozemobacteraceae bacterium]|nr:clostripain-related cysteine peptidase [Candidatus Ozemobacteraceae bacterium]